MKKSEYAILTKKLQKSFGKVKVLKGLDLAVKRGSIVALLGPNGAGKTTTIRILSTLLQPDGGQGIINGYDVVKEPAQVRASIGLTGQFAAVDEYLSGEENLQMIGRLYRLSTADANQRAKDLIEQFDLAEASARPVKTYSGGMKRRIDLAMSLIAAPPVIFLDEPTTGLDPRSRMTMWESIKALAASGTTILLTTQYMDEADHLADQIVVMDNGQVIAEGTADSLKKKIGSERLEVTIGKKADFERASKIVDGEALQVDQERQAISVASTGGVVKLRQVLQTLEDAKINVESVSLHQPTLDDVFLTLTGRTTGDDVTDLETKEKK